MQLAMVAGEASGDGLGASLVQALSRSNPRLDVCGIGGPALTRAGMTRLMAMDPLTVMGWLQPLPRLPLLLSMRSQLLDYWRRQTPQLFIGVDAPDFNLPLARRLRQLGAVTTQLVSPTVWAWRSRRVDSLREAVDQVLTLFPFEAEFLQAQGVVAQCVGHPMADQYPLKAVSCAPARSLLGLPADVPVLALLPGSRPGELRAHARVFLQAAQHLARRIPNLHCVVPAVDERAYQLLQRHSLAVPQLPVTVVRGKAAAALRACDTALVASGTATLQAALLRRPMVIAYRTDALSHALIRPRLQTPWIGLPNILSGREVVPEFVQDAVTPGALAEALTSTLQLSEAASADLNETYSALHHSLRRNFPHACQSALGLGSETTAETGGD